MFPLFSPLLYYSQVPGQACGLVRSSLAAAFLFGLGRCLGLCQARSLHVQRLWCSALDSVPSVLQLHLPADQPLVHPPGEQLEGLPHILASLGGHLYVGHPQLPGQSLCLLPAHRLLLCSAQVTFLTHQDEENPLRLHPLAHLVMPLLNMVKGGPVGHVKHQQASDRVPIVGARHWPEEMKTEWKKNE